MEKKEFNTEPYVRRIEKPWGWELHLVPETSPYMAKILHINAGARLSLQRHLPGAVSAGKVETYALHAGRAKLIWENKEGELIEEEMEPNIGYTTIVGQRHRLAGITDCEIFEASLPEGDGTTERLDDDYNRPDETAEMRKDPNRGWNPADSHE
jgi:hypothetical protein